jgi:hypothetical protein
MCDSNNHQELHTIKKKRVMTIGKEVESSIFMVSNLTTNNCGWGEGL